MPTKIKISLIAFGAVLAIAAGVYFYANSKKIQNVAQTQNTGETSTGNGTVSELPPLQIATGRNLPQAHQDATQPFAVNLPRSKEPAKPANTNPLQNQPAPQSIVQTKIDQAVSEGLIPAADGTYTQTINASGVNTYDASRYNYALAPDTFAATYYPDFQPVSQSGFSSAAPGTDSVLIDSTTTVAQPTVTTVPLVAGVDRKLFKVKSADDRQSYKTYFTTMKQVFAPLDLVNNSSIVSDILTNLNDSASSLAAVQAQDQQIIAQIQSTPVPASMLGLQESYYLMYLQFDNFVRDNIGYNTAKNSGDSAGIANYLNKIDTDSQILSSTITNTVSNIQIAAQIVTAKGYTQ